MQLTPLRLAAIIALVFVLALAGFMAQLQIPSEYAILFSIILAASAGAFISYVQHYLGDK